METWSVKELDKVKTAQAISNEEIRLDQCRVKLQRLSDEYEKMKLRHLVLQGDLEDQITRIRLSIESGEQFLNECKEHFKDFDNTETN